MYHLNNKKNNLVVTAATLFTVATIVRVAAGATTTIGLTTTIIQSAEAFMDPGANLKTEPKAPMAVSQDGDNVYIVWWTNKSGNWEVMFRAPNDGGASFGDRLT